MTDPTPRPAKSQRQKRTDAFLRAADAASLGMAGALMLGVVVMYPTMRITGWPLAIGVIALALLIYGAIGLLRHRRSDEYTLDLWHAGANWVLATLIVLEVFLPVALGIIYGSGDVHEGDRAVGKFLDEFDTAIVLAAFFVGLNLRRFGGRA